MFTCRTISPITTNNIDWHILGLLTFFDQAGNQLRKLIESIFIPIIAFSIGEPYNCNVRQQPVFRLRFYVFTKSKAGTRGAVWRLP